MTQRQQEIFDILEKHLRAEPENILLTYSDVDRTYFAMHNRRLGQGTKSFHKYLGEISHYTQREYGFAITAIVVNKKKLMPGFDYFPILSMTTNRNLFAAMWIAELSKIVAFYK